MWKKFNTALESVSSHWSLAILIAGSSVTGVATAYAAKATAWLAAWGPIGWVGTAFAGVGFFILCAMGFAWAREKIVRASIEKRFFNRPDAINPLEEEFRNKRIKIADLVSPIEPIIRGKRFRNCEIIGPANVALSATYPNAGGMANCGLSSVCAVMIRENILVLNAVMFEDCRFEDCKLHQITFLFPEGAYDWANQMLPDMPWLTVPPPQSAP